ncbi:MAG: HNH endonuclease [Bacteroidota bacterium]
MKYEDYHGKPAKIKERAARNKARLAMEKKGKVHKGDGMEVDHINGNPLKQKGNTRVITRHANRVKQ